MTTVMRDSFTRRGMCHECANPYWGDASSCGHIHFLVEQQRKPHPIGVILGSQVCKKALGHFACLVLVSVHVMTQHAVGVRIGRRHVRAVFYTKIKQQGTITSNFAATRAPMLSLLLPRNISVEPLNHRKNRDKRRMRHDVRCHKKPFVREKSSHCLPKANSSSMGMNSDVFSSFFHGDQLPHTMPS